MSKEIYLMEFSDSFKWGGIRKNPALAVIIRSGSWDNI